ncbi:POC1 centriolar protein homolog B-like [Gymnodraco acuticeps]|uniref:POC1 centriolar protein homolog B-like n=1 Tax=Gymnodraco acuticeps TaxID=8218 RepID=A0A6P8VBR1_GYMAC|nr:POC1 centriolar protein homolog B-like [Gymnodraco acuticeps]
MHNALKINRLNTSLSLCLSLFHLQLLNGRTHLTPTQAAANGHLSNGLPARNRASSGVGGWMGDESTSRAKRGASVWTGGNGGGRGRREEEDEEEEDEEEERGQTYPLEVLSAPPSSLDSTLRHIVKQLDILTQVNGVGAEERLTLTEDKLKECLLNQSQILKDVQSGERSQETDGSPVHFT